MAKTGNGRTFRGVTARTPNQKHFVQTVNEKDFTLCQGIYGSGKSWISVGLACEYLTQKKVNKIVVVRNPNGTIKDLGYSTGSWKEKSKDMYDQISEYFIQFLGKETFERLYHDDIIELTSTSLIRGRNFANTFVIMEEAQLSSRDDFILFISRIDKGSKVIIGGDINQASDGCFFKKMFYDFEDEAVGKVELTEEDIQRNKHIYRICKKIKEI